MRGVWRRRLLGLAVVVAVALPPIAYGVWRTTSRGSDGPGGTVRHQIVSGGKTREYYVYRPAGLSSSVKAPLEVVLPAHGFSTLVTSVYNPPADRQRFVIAYPISPNDWGNADDPAFVGAVIDRMIATENADPARVYVVGGSGGGWQAYAVACGQVGAKLAGVGTIFGYITTDSPSKTVDDVCSPVRPLSVFAIHGTDDGLVPYNGDCHVSKEHGNTICAISQPKTMAYWSRLDGCEPTPSRTTGPRHRVELWAKGCRSGTAVELVTVVGGGHTIESLAVDGIDPAGMLLSFLAAHPRPAAVLQAAVVEVRVTHTGSARRVVVRLRLGAAVTAHARLSAGKTAVTKAAKLPAGTATLAIEVPQKAPQGVYTLRLSLKGPGGLTRTITRTVRLPAPA